MFHPGGGGEKNLRTSLWKHNKVATSILLFISHVLEKALIVLNFSP